MIKQSQICNFVSLIKTLKKQLGSDKSKSQGETKKTPKQNVKRTSNMSRKIMTGKDHMFETIKHLNPFPICNDETFAQFKFEKRPDILQRKKIYQLYCEEKKNKAETTTRGRVGDISVEAHCRSHEIKFPHRRSNTNQIDKKLLTLIPDRIQKQQNLLNLQIIKNEVLHYEPRQNHRTNLSRSYIPTTSHKNRQKQNYLISRSSKTRLQLKKEGSKSNENNHENYQDNGRDSQNSRGCKWKFQSRNIQDVGSREQGWIIDAWEQPLEIMEVLEDNLSTPHA